MLVLSCFGHRAAVHGSIPALVGENEDFGRHPDPSSEYALKQVLLLKLLEGMGFERKLLASVASSVMLVSCSKAQCRGDEGAHLVSVRAAERTSLERAFAAPREAHDSSSSSSSSITRWSIRHGENGGCPTPAEYKNQLRGLGRGSAHHHDDKRAVEATGRRPDGPHGGTCHLQWSGDYMNLNVRASGSLFGACRQRVEMGNGKRDIGSVLEANDQEPKSWCKGGRAVRSRLIAKPVVVLEAWKRHLVQHLDAPAKYQGSEGYLDTSGLHSFLLIEEGVLWASLHMTSGIMRRITAVLGKIAKWTNFMRGRVCVWARGEEQERTGRGGALVAFSP
ncbi:hypothetical protein G7046_g1129 [Stylonectria norvegica]|nr:hypothetical protein G7046_g1129 [Stylonectria norvegica]